MSDSKNGVFDAAKTAGSAVSDALPDASTVKNAASEAVDSITNLASEATAALPEGTTDALASAGGAATAALATAGGAAVKVTAKVLEKPISMFNSFVKAVKSVVNQVHAKVTMARCPKPLRCPKVVEACKTGCKGAAGVCKQKCGCPRSPGNGP